MPMLEKVLIANRGEIALRILRACKELDIRTIAVHSKADSGLMHVRLADETVCIGAAPSTESYLNVPAIISAAEVTDAAATFVELDLQLCGKIKKLIGGPLAQRTMHENPL